VAFLSNTRQMPLQHLN